MIERLNWSIAFPGSSVARRAPALSLTHDEVLHRYRGFEGNCWPDVRFDSVPKNEFGLVDSSSVKELRSMLDRSGPRNRYDLIRLDIVGSGLESFPQAVDRFLGYEFGYFESPDNKYSVLLSEVIYGGLEPLQRFAKQLNKHLLLPDRSIGRFLAATRSNLLASGADLEQNGHFDLVAVLDG